MDKIEKDLSNVPLVSDLQYLQAISWNFEVLLHEKVFAEKKTPL